jgi:hypothetical protein
MSNAYLSGRFRRLFAPRSAAGSCGRTGARLSSRVQWSIEGVNKVLNTHYCIVQRGLNKHYCIERVFHK